MDEVYINASGRLNIKSTVQHTAQRYSGSSRVGAHWHQLRQETIHDHLLYTILWAVASHIFRTII
jgi:hypothetical protein